MLNPGWYLGHREKLLIPPRHVAGFIPAGAAAAELQKVLDHTYVVQNEVIGALAHLSLARAYALSGDNAKSNSAIFLFLENRSGSLRKWIRAARLPEDGVC